MKVGIVGYGFVGNALCKGLTKEVEIFIVDPKLNTNISDLASFKPEITFICVPTPMKVDGSQDLSILNSVVKEMSSYDSKTEHVLKSTILPQHLLEIKKILPNIVYNPEFLREKTSEQDFINSDIIIFGGNQVNTKQISNFYNKYTKCINKEYIYTDLISASLLKYTINTFLATKVIFFNEISKLHKASLAESSWTKFTEILNKDKRIGSSHMQVPGPDGRMGFGGACFPKDSNALSSYAKSLNESLSILDSAIAENNKIRSKYTSVNERESDQNITFKSDDD